MQLQMKLPREYFEARMDARSAVLGADISGGRDDQQRDWSDQQKPGTSGGEIKKLYEELLAASSGVGHSAQLHDSSRDFLRKMLVKAGGCEAEMPASPDQLQSWVEESSAQVGRDYQAYLARRRMGAPRELFTNKAHALFFLHASAPTKLVDGAWLYGALRHWRQPQMAGLIDIYLEELGRGVPSQNHVVLYRRLLEAEGCADLDDLDDDYFVQGAIQLALARHSDEFFPELLGFNLGYEQMPLHLLITAHELKELNLDPYYFTLHATIDNSISGHAKKALQSVLTWLPAGGAVGNDANVDFYKRVIRGCNLNQLGVGARAMAARFDLESELIKMLARKSELGRLMHCDRCRIGGAAITDWLSHPERMSDFVQAMVSSGWVIKNQDPGESRFWRLLHGDKPPMFGVFSRAEEQLIHDWIAGDFVTGTLSPTLRRGREIASEKNIARDFDGDDVDLNGDIRSLKQELRSLPGKDSAMNRLLPLLAPSHHALSVGLFATRKFTQMLRG